MNKLFIKDIQGNLWSLDKVVGLVNQQNPEDGTTQYIIVMEGGMSAEISMGMYFKLVELLIVLEIEEDSEGE